MTILNLTPHAITLAPSGKLDGSEIILAPSGAIARVTMTPGELQSVEGIPVPVAGPDTVGGVEGVPAPQEGVFLLVSGMVGGALKGRPDILVPGTGPKDNPIRHPKKKFIIAVTRLKWV